MFYDGKFLGGSLVEPMYQVRFDGRHRQHSSSPKPGARDVYGLPWNLPLLSM
jgi:hypothetical protein